MNTIAHLGLRTLLDVSLLLSAGWLANPPLQAGASADLWQARNGLPTSPNDPVDWVKGNVGAANSHYAEGYSIPYRVVVTSLSTGSHNLVIEWDTEQSGKH